MRRLGRLAARSAVAVLLVLATLASMSFGYDVGSARTLPVPPPGPGGADVVTGDVTTRYEHWGSKGSAIVLVHGFVESSYAWHAVGPLLGSSHRVYALDVRGWGYTTHRPPYTLASQTAQLVGFLTALQLRHVVLVGHSSGAAIVANAAIERPDLVAGVVFLDGDGTPYGVGGAGSRSFLVDPFLTALLRLATRSDALVRTVYHAQCGPSCPRLTTAEVHRWTGPFRVPGAEAALKSMARHGLIGLTHAQLRQLPARGVPAEIVYGALDELMSSQVVSAARRDVQAVTVTAIPGVGHLSMLAAPVAVTTAIDRAAGRWTR